MGRVLVFGTALCVGLWSAAAYARASALEPTAAPAGLWERDQLLGDLGGLRPALGERGFTLGLQEISEVLGRATGSGTGANYEGLTTMDVSLDTVKAFHWPGGTFNLSVLQIHGSQRSAHDFDDFQHVSGIEANRTTRLWELWYQQVLPGGKADVKIGQQSLDQEFIVSQYSAVFLDMMMGWPMLSAADLYGGGPAYPLSSLGVRARVQTMSAWTLLGGVFDDNPPGGPFDDDSQLRGAEASGTRFNLSSGALWIGELQYEVNAAHAEDRGTLPCGLPGTYKLGAWYDTAGFPDQRFDNAGLSLANPAGSGAPRTDSGNYGVYAVVEQMVWRQPDGPRSIGVFARLMGAPADRNLMDFSLNAGMVVTPLAERGVFGIGFGWAHVSGSASGLDRDTERFTGEAVPVRSAERFIEVTYQYPATPWWQIQPDLQYLENPGGGLPDPQDPVRWLGREFVFGLRTTITF